MADIKLFAELRLPDNIQAISYGSEAQRGRHKPWRTFGALELTVTRTPPLRTGLLTTGRSDLDV